MNDGERYLIEQFDPAGKFRGIRAWFTSQADAEDASRRLNNSNILHELHRLVKCEVRQSALWL